MSLYTHSKRLQRVADVVIRAMHEAKAVRHSPFMVTAIAFWADYYSVSEDKLTEVVLDLTEGQQ